MGFRSFQKGTVGICRSKGCEVTGHQTTGVLSLADIFRGFMNNTSILTQPGLSPLGIQTPPPTNWTDCFPLNCLSFDDQLDDIDLNRVAWKAGVKESGCLLPILKLGTLQLLKNKLRI